jgi:RNA polymerase primary sigma factor
MNDAPLLAPARERAGTRGYITYAELNDLLPDGPVDIPVLEELLTQLEQEGIPAFNTEAEYQHHLGRSLAKKSKKGKKKKEKKKEPVEFKDSVNRFMKLLGRVPPMDDAERELLMAEVAALEQTGAAEDEIFRLHERLIQGHLRLVVSLTHGYTNRGVDLSDLIQEGNQALVTAVRKFRYPAGRHDFIPFVMQQVRSSLADLVRRQGGAVSISKQAQLELGALTREHGALEQFTENNTNDDHKNERKLEAAKRMQDIRGRKRSVSLNASQDDGETGPDYLDDERAINQMDAVVANETKTMLRDQLNYLNHLEQEVLSLRYGLDTEVFMTWQEIAAALGISVQRVQNVEARALQKLRKRLRPAEE